MSDEILVTNSGFAMVSGWHYYNSSRITLTGTVSRYLNGHQCKAQGQIYDTLFTDNNLYMYIDYAIVDNGGWSNSNSVSWEAVNGTAARSIACSTSHAGYVRWRVRWEAYGGDGKTYLDYSAMLTHSAYYVESTSPGTTRGKLLYHLAAWNFTSGFPTLQLNHGTLLNTTCGILAI
ncbi:hypothetical protein SDC9_05173 [bioreactor metagenome]|uniref:Uncharacterized protein n=1 Tax=bioreactor metagenome TaxID=1076179 RepID=A0A644SY95_9ZZZZ